jgi:hypothetical protein
MAIHLYVNYYRDPSAARQAEIDAALARNLENAFIARVVVLGDARVPRDHPKITYVPCSPRPTFRTYFEVVNHHSSAADVNVIANSDIYFDDSLERLSTSRSRTAASR